VKKVIKYSVVLLALCIGATILFAQGSWKQVKDSDGIKVFTRPVEGSDMDEFMGVTTIDVPYGVVGEVLRDIPAQTEWMADCMASKLLKTIAENDLVVYNATKTPWPVSNRDVVLKTSTSIDLKKGVVNVNFKAVNDAEFPAKDGFVRMPDLTGKWKLERLEPSKTKVTYNIKANPGGSIPSSIANMTSKNLPFKTLKNLKKMVTKEKYVESAKAKYGKNFGI
jgi:hypothetical protein